MGLPQSSFLVNFKVAPETAGEDGRSIVDAIERVRADTGARFAVAPHLPDLRWIAEQTPLPVVAQTATPRERAGLGGATLEGVADAGVDAAFLTHPERDAGLADIGRAVDRCRELGLESIVWAPDRETANAALTFDPDWLLFERPADIAADDGLLRTEPARLERVVAMVDDENPRTSVFVGGGIRTAADVARAFEYGADATGAASALLEADDRAAWLRSIATAVPSADE
ncbi:triose-phosphate isomerase [Salinadaptatus halalkaliphilus]|uniref:Triose-phosphate isomerase n=1 Tax=Salinadaptatus halalkaliphilus TaxID=2419781 RepID=A0A4S3TIY5_9EURY|nr:triose-phosphate isomerase [Salinadaptatus halalkaliphilus]THE63922.1 triose-phosphate isomerase [Salinadaptatus halalkaliphilus]